jgi:hypothetical protein
MIKKTDYIISGVIATLLTTLILIGIALVFHTPISSALWGVLSAAVFSIFFQTAAYRKAMKKYSENGKRESGEAS